MIVAEEVLEYIEADKSRKSKFEYLLMSLKGISNIRGGHDGTLSLVNIINFDYKLECIKTFISLATGHGSLSKYALVNWMNYNLANIILISTFCTKLINHNFSNHLINAIGPKYSVAYVWFEKGSLFASFVLWNNDKQTTMQERIRFVMQFQNYEYPVSEDFQTNFYKTFSLVAISAKTNHKKTCSTYWKIKLIDVIQSLVDTVSK